MLSWSAMACASPIAVTVWASRKFCSWDESTVTVKPRLWRSSPFFLPYLTRMYFSVAGTSCGEDTYLTSAMDLFPFDLVGAIRVKRATRRRQGLKRAEMDIVPASYAAPCGLARRPEARAAKHRRAQ